MFVYRKHLLFYLWLQYPLAPVSDLRIKLQWRQRWAEGAWWLSERPVLGTRC